MTLEKTQYLSSREFANRFNSKIPLDENHLPIEPSFVELLCQQGKIENSVLPSRDGRKKDVYMIPEYEIESLMIMLSDEGKKEEESKVEEPKKEMLNIKETCAMLDLDRTYVNKMVRDGKLKAVKVENTGRRRGRYGFSYMFEEDEILKYMEAHPKKRTFNQKKEEKKVDAATETPRQNDILTSLKDENLKLKAQIVKLEKALQVDSFESYRKAYRDGFKDGFVAAGGAE